MLTRSAASEADSWPHAAPETSAKCPQGPSQLSLLWSFPQQTEQQTHLDNGSVVRGGPRRRVGGRNQGLQRFGTTLIKEPCVWHQRMTQLFLPSLEIQ